MSVVNFVVTIACPRQVLRATCDDASEAREVYMCVIFKERTHRVMLSDIWPSKGQQSRWRHR